MQRVALIRNSYQYDFGGGEIFPVNLAKLLLEHGYKPIILSSNKKTLAYAKQAHIKTARSPWWSFQNFSGRKMIFFPAYFLWILATTCWYVVFFIHHRIDVVHPQSRDDFVSATFAAKLLRKKVIWSDHADLKHIYMNHQTWYKNPVGKLVYFASRFADCVIEQSLSEKKLVEKSLGKALPSNYVMIHPGTVDTYKPSAKKKAVVTFVSTSRLVEDKGIKELIEAFMLLPASDARLVICGDGPDAEKFKHLAMNARNIVFAGHVDNVIDILQGADVFVHPTYHEGFGLSLVEAEMCALPIIASRVGSIPEIVKDGINGLLVEPKNIQELTTAMEKLIHSPALRTEMSRRSREIFLETFQFDRIVKEKILPIYYS